MYRYQHICYLSLYSLYPRSLCRPNWKAQRRSRQKRPGTQHWLANKTNTDIFLRTTKSSVEEPETTFFSFWPELGQAGHASRVLSIMPVLYFCHLVLSVWKFACPVFLVSLACHACPACPVSLNNICKIYEILTNFVNFTAIIFHFIDKLYTLDPDPHFEYGSRSGSRRQLEYGSMRNRIHNTGFPVNFWWFKKAALTISTDWPLKIPAGGGSGFRITVYG